MLKELAVLLEKICFFLAQISQWLPKNQASCGMLHKIHTDTETRHIQTHTDTHMDFDIYIYIHTHLLLDRWTDM